MSKKIKIENMTSEEFATLMKNDPDFKKEMVQRQMAAIDRLETKMKESNARRDKRSKEISTLSQSNCGNEDSVIYGVACSAQFIKTAPPQALQKAVKEHRLSLARYRIEMKRRRNRDYYDNMPDRTYEYLSTP